MSLGGGNVAGFGVTHHLWGGVCVPLTVRTSGPQGSHLSCRQCALAALRDVKQYLTEEAGQIAVRDALCGGWH